MARWWRRDRARHPVPAEPADAPAGSAVPAVRVERALVALAVHAQQLEDRLARIEQQLTDQQHQLDAAEHRVTAEAATHEELLEVRIHSAKVAAEVARLSVNLQARIDDIAVRVPSAARQQRVQTLAESILDLSDRLEPTPVDLRDVDDGRRTA